MRPLALFLIIIIILWACFWWISVQRTEDSVLNWFNRDKLIQERSYKKITTSGFPNRADLSIEDFFISDFRQKNSLYIDLLQILTLIYRNNHFIFIFKPPVEIKLQQKNFQINGPPIKSSLRIDKKTQLNDLIAQGQNLQLKDPNNNIWTISDFLFAAEKTTQNNPATYKTHLTINGINIPNDYLKITGDVSLDHQNIPKITFDSNVQLEAKTFKTLRFHNFKVSNLELTIDWGLLTLNLAGDLNLVTENLINGSLELMVEDWQRALSMIQIKNIVDKKLFKKIKPAITFLASQASLEKKRLKLPINIYESNIYLGPLKIGKINLQK